MENNTVTNEIVKHDSLTASERFTNLVVKEYLSTAPNGAFELSAVQKRLIQGYFLVIDKALNTAEENRIRKNENNKNHDYDNNIPYDWSHLNLRSLALDAVHYARMGIDMQEKNHLFPIPFANKKNGNYDIAFMLGYGGIQYIAEKYALVKPKNVTVELKYSTDDFVPLKKSKGNPVESYEFRINNPFDRGTIEGGFGYIEYDDPSKNELIIMTLNDIKKRMGKNANAEFWGTEFTGKQISVWENGKKVNVDTEGWQAEMCRKTIIREVYSEKHIPRDPAKYDDEYQYLRERSVAYEQAEVEAEAHENANSVPIDIPDEQIAAIEDKASAQIAVQTTTMPVNEQKEAVPTNNTPASQKPVNGFTDPDF